MSPSFDHLDDAQLRAVADDYQARADRLQSDAAKARQELKRRKRAAKKDKP